MTEEEWRELRDPEAIATKLFYQNSFIRKERLFAVACGRRALRFLNEISFADLLAKCEAFADGHFPATELNELSRSLIRHSHGLPTGADGDPDSTRNAARAILYAAEIPFSRDPRYFESEDDLPYPVWSAVYSCHAGSHKTPAYFQAATEAERKLQRCFLRDIFGNPFRPVAFDPKWRTEHTVGLALRMYDDREFAAMPILADALEEAGCDSADILTHCREPGVHVRGCWVVDLVLGKA